MITGAIAVLDFYDIRTHETLGWITAVVVLAAMIVAFVSKPKYNALRYSSVVLFVLVVLQGILGSSVETSDLYVAVHFAVSLLIYGGSVVLVFRAFRWDRMGSVLTS